jgi:hypothetical protein
VSQNQSKSNLPQITQNKPVPLIRNSELSIYNDQKTPQGFYEAWLRLESCFPTLDTEYWDILQNRANANGFTDKRLMDAINHTIDTCKYPKPSIADIIGYNKSIKLYSYDEMIHFITENNVTTNFFKSVLLNERRVWIKLSEYEANQSYFESL